MKKVFFLIAFAVYFSGCTHPDVYPNVPTLEFKSMSFDTGALGRTFTLVATFTDGDGDIGYYQDRPNDSIFDDTLSQYYYNFVITLQVYKHGIWVDSTYNADSSLIYNVNTRLPYLTQDGQNRGLKGDIEKTDYLPKPFNDTLRYRAFIYDRALHKSNEIVTPAYFVNNL